MLVDDIRDQAAACAELGSPMYAELLDRLATDVAAGGPAAEVLAGHEDADRDAATPLRLMGAVHRLVLERRAPALALHYPSVGGTFADADAAWAAFRDVLADDADALRPLLELPPQTNEVGRSAALLGALLHLAAEHPLPVRLLEVGASAGLNLRADRFRYRGEGREWGPPDSAVLLDDAWRGEPPPDVAVHVTERHGCDADPLDPATTEGRLTLTSYVWADQRTRLERLRAAFAVAAQVPATVARQGAAAFLDEVELRPGAATVVWHSVMWQYVDAEEQRQGEERLLALGGQATGAAPFARITLEPRRDRKDGDMRLAVTLRAWPGGEERVLGTAHPHGLPVTWDSTG